MWARCTWLDEIAAHQWLVMLIVIQLQLELIISVDSVDQLVNRLQSGHY